MKNVIADTLLLGINTTSYYESRPQQGSAIGGGDTNVEEILAEKCLSFQDEDGCGYACGL